MKPEGIIFGKCVYKKRHAAVQQSSWLRGTAKYLSSWSRWRLAASKGSILTLLHVQELYRWSPGGWLGRKREKKKALGWLKWLGFVWKQLWLDVWFSRKPHQREVMGETAGPAMCAIWLCSLPTTRPMFPCSVFGISHQTTHTHTHTYIERYTLNKERNCDADTFLDHKTPNDGFGILFPYWSALSDQMYASWPNRSAC